MANNNFHLADPDLYEEFKLPRATVEAATTKSSKSSGPKLVRCNVCAHHCVIAPGKTGICGIRKNIKGKLYLIPYGKGFVHIDPMEKKPLYHFYPGEPIVSVGTIGCNFKCLFCQNYDISQVQHFIDAEKVIQNLQDLPPEKIVQIAKDYNINFIAYTYNEPTVYFEYTYDTAVLAKKHGIKNVYVSNGYQSKEAAKKLTKVLDAINIDLKSFNNEFYLKLTGAKLQPVLDNIKFFYEQGVWLEVTTLVIPGHNDSEKELTQIAEFIKSISPDIPWHISRFFPAYKMLNTPPTDLNTLIKAYEIGKKVGLNYVYIGNIPSTPESEKYNNTYCPKCGNLLIKRNGYDTKIIGMKGNKCSKCGYTIAGRFAESK